MRRLPRGLELVGAVVTTLAFFWWLVFFADKGLELFMGNYLVCFVYTTGLCAVLNATAEFRGEVGYYPFIAWIGIGCLIIGAVLDRKIGGDIVLTKDD